MCASGAGWRSSPAPGSASPESIGNERIFAYLGAKCDLVVEMKPGTRKRTGCDDDGATDARPAHQPTVVGPSSERQLAHLLDGAWQRRCRRCRCHEGGVEGTPGSTAKRHSLRPTFLQSFFDQKSGHFCMLVSPPTDSESHLRRRCAKECKIRGRGDPLRKSRGVRRVAKHSGARRRREYLEETGSARAARAQGAQQDLLSRAAGPAVAGWLQVDTTANQTTMSATSPRHTRSAGAPVHPSAEAGFRPGDSIVCDYDIERTENQGHSVITGRHKAPHHTSLTTL